MTSKQLASACGVSQRTIFNLRSKFPAECPKSFEDTAGWQKIVEAHRVVVAQKRHAPRSAPGEISDNARYVKARADRTEVLAEAERIRLAAAKRDLVARVEVEAAFNAVASRVKARLRRLTNDAPSMLLGLSAVQIHKILGEQIELALNEIAGMPDGFYDPAKG